MNEQKRERGQSLVEMAMVLPVLLIFFIGVAEMGVALRNYLVVVNSSREGCRFAARGGFNDELVGERVVIAGGSIRAGDFVTGTESVPFLRTHSYDEHAENAGVIVTHIVLSSTGTVLSTTHWYTGVVLAEGDEITDSVPIAVENSLLDIGEITTRHVDSTQKISEIRAAAMVDERENHVVIVEVFFLHPLLLDLPLVPLPNPIQLYARTEMRIWGE
jgi:hypothetical protein